MRRKVGNFVAAVFVSVSLGVTVAQTTIPYPELCKKAYLENLCGEEWRLCYAAMGCWLFGPPPDSDSFVAMNPKWISHRNLRFR